MNRKVFTSMEMFIAMIICLGLIIITIQVVKSDGISIGVDEQGSKYILENIYGFKDIQITGYDWWSCDETIFSTGFIAKSPNGGIVRGAVCSDLINKWVVFH